MREEEERQGWQGGQEGAERLAGQERQGKQEREESQDSQESQERQERQERQESQESQERQERQAGQARWHQRILLTGGRAPATLDLARQLAVAGHQVYMAESCPDHLCVHSRAIVRNYSVPKPNENPDGYISALQEIILLEKIDWLIPTCEEIFFVARGLDRLSQHCLVFTDSLDKLRCLHSKWEFIGQAREFGLLVPATSLLTSQEEAKAVLAVPGKWVFKPVYSRFAAKVFMVQTRVASTVAKGEKNKNADETEIPDEIEIPDETEILEKMKHLSPQQPWVVQQFVEGTAYCSYSIAKQGKLTAHAVYPVRFTAGPGACISFEAVHHPEIDRWVQHFVSLVQFTGQISFDFIVTDDGQVYPIECNPRATSGIHLFQAEDQIDQAFFHHEEGSEQVITPRPSHKAIITLAMLSYGLLSIRSWTKFKEWLRLIIGGKDVVFRLRDPRPFLQQFKLLWWNVKVSRQQHISILEASTHDIEWNGEEAK
ncbi:ATP-grasp domain-containing protein [Paenibacillus ihumii]|uniref:ATP-grasp domain-containing protein n=1 Tax=Paenibacillus ihumii TaxID=687436 RepID=UPI0006D8596D|nr:ATP-grasp domain-containing protein [Paenibacillus ihumii]